MPVHVQAEDFDPGGETERLSAVAGIGGVTTFTGVVRETSGEGRLTSMTLEHYPGMTERKLAEIEAEAYRRWPALQAVTIIHRYGRLEPGARIVFVGTASAHRDVAFDACRFLIDWLKTKAPFWKMEETTKGAHWVDAKTSDDETAARWEAQPPSDSKR